MPGLDDKTPLIKDEERIGSSRDDVKTCANEKSHDCDKCGKAFKRGNTLKSHLKLAPPV